MIKPKKILCIVLLVLLASSLLSPPVQCQAFTLTYDGAKSQVIKAKDWAAQFWADSASDRAALAKQAKKKWSKLQKQIKKEYQKAKKGGKKAMKQFQKWRQQQEREYWAWYNAQVGQ